MSLQPITHPDEQAVLDDLTKLAIALTERGYQAQVYTPPGKLPFLYARNPRVTALSERIFAQADNFFWPWADPIAARDQVTEAATTVARVLATSTGD
jgi:hypothetical protein